MKQHGSLLLFFIDSATQFERGFSFFFTPEGQAATGRTIYTGNNGPFHVESPPIRFQAWMEPLSQFIKAGAKANLVPKYQAKVQMLPIVHVNLDLMNSGGPYCDTTQCDGILRVWIYYTMNLIPHACLLRLDPAHSFALL